MARMIIAGVSETSRDQMTRLLASSGYSVYRCCTSGSSLRRALAESEDSILIYLGLLPDCRPEELVWDYGERVQILWIAKPAVLEDCESPEVFRLSVPVSGQAVIGALEMLNQLHRRHLQNRRRTICCRSRRWTTAQRWRSMRPELWNRNNKRNDTFTGGTEHAGATVSPLS